MIDNARSDRKPRAYQKLGNSPRVGKCPAPRQGRIGKCPAVAGGGGVGAAVID